MKYAIYILAIVFGYTLATPPHQPAPLLKNSIYKEPPTPVVELLPEISGVDYYFKPPLGNAYSFARGNCTFGVSSWTAVPISGNANQWDDNARAAGYEVRDYPIVGDVGVSNVGYYGHVTLVVQVDGNRVYVKEMNYKGLGVVSYRWANASEFVYIAF